MFGSKIKTVLTIEGMMCHNCEKHMEEAIKNNFSVKSVKASHDEKEAIVVSSQKLDSNRIKEVVEETGYQLLSIKVEE